MKTALLLAASLPLMCLDANAYEIHSGAVTICDTQGQVERYVQLSRRKEAGARIGRWVPDRLLR